ncbi:MAG: FAD-dependent oxidoreductase [Gammaproteobacteria bacterium]
MDRYDVLIVGGGPAGSSCARRLVQQGLSVAVLDKARFPRDKVCAGWVTPAVMETLEVDLADYGRTRTLQPITGFLSGTIGGVPVRTDYGRTVSYGIRRCEFDQYLLERAGAELRLGERFESMERRDGAWIVNGGIAASLVVGAGGHFCPVARELGARLGSSESVVAAKEIEFPMDEVQRRSCQVEAQVPELYFCTDLMGYGWCFRKGDYLNIGLGREDNHKLSERLQAFCAYLAERGRIPADIPARFHGHAYLLYGHAPRQVVGDAVLLVGDAAGPRVGECAVEGDNDCRGSMIKIEAALVHVFMLSYTHFFQQGRHGFGRLNPPLLHLVGERPCGARSAAYVLLPVCLHQGAAEAKPFFASRHRKLPGLHVDGRGGANGVLQNFLESFFGYRFIQKCPAASALMHYFSNVHVHLQSLRFTHEM